MSFIAIYGYYRDHDQYVEEVLHLDAETATDAVDEAIMVFAAEEFEDLPSPEALESLQVYECADPSTVVDVDRVQALHATRQARWKVSKEEWNRTAEQLRDELGHWRTLHRRGNCPQEQVTLLEDRLAAHLNSRP